MGASEEGSPDTRLTPRTYKRPGDSLPMKHVAPGLQHYCVELDEVHAQLAVIDPKTYDKTRN